MPPLILALSLKGLPDNFMLCQSFCSTVPPSQFPSATPSRPPLPTHAVVVMYKFSVVVRKMCSRFIHLLFCSIPWVSCGCLSVYSRVYNTHTHTPTHTHVCVDRAFLPPLRRFAQNSILNLESSNRNRNRFGPRRQTPQTANYIHST